LHKFLFLTFNDLNFQILEKSKSAGYAAEYGVGESQDLLDALNDIEENLANLPRLSSSHRNQHSGLQNGRRLGSSQVITKRDLKVS